MKRLIAIVLFLSACAPVPNLEPTPFQNILPRSVDTGVILFQEYPDVGLLCGDAGEWGFCSTFTPTQPTAVPAATPTPTITATPTATPTSTATSLPPEPPTKTPVSPTILDINGGFEQTTQHETSGWRFYNTGVGLPEINIEMEELNADPATRRSGRHSLRMIAHDTCLVAGMFRQVQVPLGAMVEFGAYLKTWASSSGWHAPSDVAVNLFNRIGLDPYGSNNPRSANIIWASVPNNHDSWQGALVEGRARTTFVTLIVEVNLGWVGYEDAGGPACRWGLHNMAEFIDDLTASYRQE